MTEMLTNYDIAIEANDASTLTETNLRDVSQNFMDPTYLHVGPSPTASPVQVIYYIFFLICTKFLL